MTQLAPSRRFARSAAIIEPQSLFVPYLAATLRGTGLDIVRAAGQIRPRHLARLAPDVLLVGIDEFPAPLSAVRRFRRLLPAARLVVYTHCADAAWQALARACGADAVIGPTDDEARLILACNAPENAVSG